MTIFTLSSEGWVGTVNNDFMMVSGNHNSAARVDIIPLGAAASPTAV